ncbi:hypothetical protein [Halpernia sp. GG3]
MQLIENLNVIFANNIDKMKINAYIKGTGSYVPPKILKNDFFEAVGSSGLNGYLKT